MDEDAAEEGVGVAGCLFMLGAWREREEEEEEEEKENDEGRSFC